MYTTRDVEINHWGGGCNSSFTVPLGTELMLVSGPGGGYAVKSVKIAAEICGDAWDAEHRYIFIPKDAVGSAPELTA